MKLHYALVIAGPMIAIACGSADDLRLGGEEDGGGSSCPPTCGEGQDGASNVDGSNGDPDASDRRDGDPDAEPIVCIPKPTDKDGGNTSCVTELATGNGLSCALKKDSTIWCWGSNGAGSLGNGSKVALSSTPVQVLTAAGGAPFTAQALSVGNHFACAVKNGSPWCWGINNQAQLGVGDATFGNKDVPTQATIAGAPLTGVTRVVAGSSHACAIKGTELWCWGSNEQGQLGRGTTGGSSGTPEAVKTSAGGPALTGVVGAALGASHTCAWKADGSAWCWGDNGFGQLGVAGVARSVPVQAAIASVAELAAGQYHSCARKTDGSLSCWGMNNAGQLGTGLPGGATPQVVLAGKGCDPITVREVAAGGNTTCVTMSDQSAWCWGGNDLGQLGTGDQISQAYPKRVKTLENVFAIAPAGGQTCAARGNGTTWCWGDGQEGTLGNGTAPKNPTSEPVSTSLTCP